MNTQTRLVGMLASVPSDARLHVERLLRQIVHDVNAPLATFSMEVFSARQLLENAGPAAPEGQTALGSDSLTELAAIFANLESASSALSTYLGMLASLAAAKGPEQAEPASPAGNVPERRGPP